MRMACRLASCSLVHLVCCAALTNWAGNVHYGRGGGDGGGGGADETMVVKPSNLGELKATMSYAAEAGLPVHAVGSRHSFSCAADVPSGRRRQAGKSKKPHNFL